jgi:hypothetical protein
VKGDCILTKPNSSAGYRVIRQGHGLRVNAAKVALEKSLGRPLAPGNVADHLCRNRSCVNPEHLEEVTLAENTRRANFRADEVPCPAGHVGSFTRYPNGRGRHCRTCDVERHGRRAVAS